MNELFQIRGMKKRNAKENNMENKEYKELLDLNWQTIQHYKQNM